LKLFFVYSRLFIFSEVDDEAFANAGAESQRICGLQSKQKKKVFLSIYSLLLKFTEGRKVADLDKRGGFGCQSRSDGGRNFWSRLWASELRQDCVVKRSLRLLTDQDNSERSEQRVQLKLETKSNCDNSDNAGLHCTALGIQWPATKLIPQTVHG
jgi:hypothetical protein